MSRLLVDVLRDYERVMQTHSARWTREDRRAVNTVQAWCAWYRRTYGEELVTERFSDAEWGRRSAIAFREDCQKWGSGEAYRRKREHIRRFLNWCVITRQIAADPFEDVPPMQKRPHLRRVQKR
ncbi:MAG: hypothetical protein HC853_00040 [Anaerolineae bacterium]|nr:hypothetical protein [Anaerolineae bacterium]